MLNQPIKPICIILFLVLFVSACGDEYENLSDCQKCLNNSELAQLIHTELPELKLALQQHPLKAANLLLNWSANNINYALTSAAVKKAPDFGKLTAAQMYNYFQTKAGGVYCGGISVFYNQVLNLFNIPSFTVDFGATKILLTHVTVIVPRKINKDEWRYYIFDPTFNITLHHKNTDYYLPLREIFKAHQKGKANEIGISNWPLQRREYIALANEDKYCPRLINKKDGALICEDSNFGLKEYFRRHEAIYKKNKLSADMSGFISLLRNRILYIGGSSNQDALNHFTHYIKSEGIPVGGNGD
jgi:hypothetical protein